MRKVCVLVLVLLFGTASYGAVSGDVYVRKDVFEAYMQGMNSKLDIILEQMRDFKEEMKSQREEHNTQMKELRGEMNAIREEQKAQVKELKDEMGSIREEVKVQVKELKDDMATIREEVKVQVKELKDEMATIREEQKAQRGDITELTRVVSVLSERVERNSEKVSSRIDDLRSDIYLGLVILGIVAGLPAFQKMFQLYAERKPSITLEDVERLIDKKLSGNVQA